MPEPAIRLAGVTKRYRLYSGVAERALDVLGLGALRFGRPARYAEYPALDGVALEIAHGERVGIVGRNGAGKTTLLKLIAGNFAPTTGEIAVKGRVQALMSVGLGFHPEFTGNENIRSALVYNGLPEESIEAAAEEICEFAELGDYLDQPMRTYSQGMQARLMFAAATAVKPDILIVDEVLGAGDAYFSAKSAHRMERLAASGCTLLLVSHSMQQVIQFCSRAVWLERGKVAMDGPVLAVVKAYEEFAQRLDWEASQAAPRRQSVLDNAELRGRILARILGAHGDCAGALRDESAQSVGGISRWAGEAGLRITDVSITGGSGLSAPGIVKSGQPLSIAITIQADATGNYPCIFAAVLFTEDGRVLARHVSDQKILDLEGGKRHTATLVYDRTLLGNGVYFFSVAVYRELDLRRLGSAKFYDLLSRSFEFRVIGEFADDPSLFHHPVRWS